MALGRAGGAGANIVYAVDACRTPVGKIKGALAAVRPDHLSADVIAALLARNPWLDPARIDDVYWGAATRPARTTGTPPGWRHCWPASRWRSPAPR